MEDDAVEDDDDVFEEAAAGRPQTAADSHMLKKRRTQSLGALPKDSLRSPMKKVSSDDLFVYFLLFFSSHTSEDR